MAVRSRPLNSHETANTTNESSNPNLGDRLRQSQQQVTRTAANEVIVPPPPPAPTSSPPPEVPPQPQREPPPPAPAPKPRSTPKPVVGQTVYTTPAPAVVETPAPAQVAPTPKRRKAYAMLPGSDVDRFAIRVIRGGAWALLFISFLGSMVALNGGWTPILAAFPNWAALRTWENYGVFNGWALLLGFGIQFWITIVEWHFRHQRVSLWYLVHLGIGSFLSYLGFRDILVPFFTGGVAQLTGADTIIALALAHCITLGIGIALDILPEQILVD